VSPRKELRNAVGLFLLTLVSVYFTYGWLWSDGSPLRDGQTIRDSVVFALALMSILGAHELAHYWVARRHGFALSLPYFIPFPMAFGTLGAVIRLRSLPKSRTALLEMGAAGPIAGAVLAFLYIGIGLPGTIPIEAPPIVEDGVEVLIFGNPVIMDQIGVFVLGQAPGRYDVLTPLALAGWVGCFLTALNMLPIGQLDGGHVLTGLCPRWAPWLSKIFLGLLFLAGVWFWTGWAIWGVLLLIMGAWENLEVPLEPPLSRRAVGVAIVAVVLMGLCLMARPLEMETVAYLPGALGVQGL
jgi:membrane-associated protease RseP (regulator of RpoE activity)